MASFTDNPELLSRFNPYVQQLPVEAMVSVGQQKQQQYDLGVQKIQDHIEKVAGLDIVRPVDKQNLQSKLNNLKGDLRKVSAGDFSNYQLVNSVGGMASKIGKDTDIQNAVSNTIKFRKDQAEVEEARKSGKGSPQNEAFWQNEANNWLSSQDVKTPYSAKYVPYTDMDAKLRELAKDIPEIENASDMPFKRDLNGQFEYDASGNPIPDAAMLRISSKGKSSQKILDNFMASLDENDIRQLQIDGWYHYRGATKETFKKQIVKNYTEAQTRVEDRMVDISGVLSGGGKLTEAERLSLQSELSSYEKMLKNGDFKNKMTTELQGLESAKNLDQYKYQIYTQKFLGDMSNALAYESKKSSYENNPYWQADMKIQELNYQYAKMRQDDEQFKANYAINAAKLTLEGKKFEAEFGGVDGIIGEPTPKDTDLTPPTVKTVEDKAIGLEVEMTNLKNEHAKSMIADYDKLPNNEAKQKAFDDLVSSYTRNPASITDWNDRSVLEQYRQMQIKQQQYHNLKVNAQQESSKYDTQIEKELQNTPPLTVAETGQTYTAQEIAGINSELKKWNYSSNFLEKYKGTKLEEPARAILNDVLARGSSAGSSSQKSIAAYSRNLNKVITPKINQALEAKSQFESDYIAQRLPEYQSTIGTLSPNNKMQMDKVEQLVGNTNDLLNRGEKMDLSRGETYDPATVVSWRTGDDKTQVKYLVEKRGDGSGVLVIQKGGDKQVIPLNPTRFSQYFPEYSQVNPVTPILDVIKMNAKNTTNSLNLTNKDAGAAVGAYFSGSSDYFPLLKNTEYGSKVRFDVEGAYNNNGSSSDRYQIVMYVDPGNGGWKRDIVTSKGMIPAENILPLLNNIGEKKVKEVLNKD